MADWRRLGRDTALGVVMRTSAEPLPYTAMAELVVIAVCVAVALCAVVWHLRRETGQAAPAARTADEEVRQIIAQAEAAVEVPPPLPPAAPTVQALAPPVDPFPVGVNRYTPVWAADDTLERPFVKVHRVYGDGRRTPEGFVIVAANRKLGATLPAGEARATRQVTFCRSCWPPVPVMPGRPLPRRAPR